MRIAIGCDHRGLEVKRFITEIIEAAGHNVTDCGTYTEDAVDYPDIARAVASVVVAGECELGVLICNTGIGMSIAANKVRGTRAALCCDAFMAGRARQHNDANILCVGTEGERETLREIVTAFLTAEFEGGRHQRRVDKIGALEG
jgi:ribose 5-phosphate isomerase B